MEIENKVIKLIVYNMDTDEYEEIEMDADAYQAMCEAEDKYYKEQKDFLEEMYRIERENAYYAVLWEEAYEKQLDEEYVKRIKEDLEGSEN